MPKCDCGFDFGKARLERRLESYAAISDRDYIKVIRKESAILSEKNPDKKMALIANAAQNVGSLWRCPQCGDWLFMKPQKGKESPIIRLKPAD